MANHFDELLARVKMDSQGVMREFGQSGRDIDAVRGLHGETLLHFCSIEGLLQSVEVLLMIGADPNARSKYGSTPLMDAALLGHEAIVEVLLKAGADPELEDRTGTTLLEKLYLLNSNPRVLRLILEHSQP